MPGKVDNKNIYHLAVLIPFWVLELLGEILVIAGGVLGLSAWIALADQASCFDDGYGDEICYGTDQQDLNIGYGAFGAALGLGIAFVILHIIQIALFGRKRLTPAANFGIELSRVIIWLAIMILQIIAYSNNDGTALALAFVIVVWALYLGSTIYSIVIFHRSRKGAYNGSSAYPTSSAAYHAPATYTAPQTQQPAAQQNYGPGPYKAPEVQQHYGPGPYQHPSEIHQQNQYQQPNQYQASSYAPTHGTISPAATPLPSYAHPAYPPPQQQLVSEKEHVNHQ